MVVRGSALSVQLQYLNVATRGGVSPPSALSRCSPETPLKATWCMAVKEGPVQFDPGGSEYDLFKSSAVPET